MKMKNLCVLAQKMSFKKIPGHVPGTRTIPAPPPVPGRRPLLCQKYFFGPVLADLDYLPANHKECVPTTLPETDRSYTHLTFPLISSGYKTVSRPTEVDVTQKVLESADEVPRVGFRIEGAFGFW